LVIAAMQRQPEMNDWWVPYLKRSMVNT
jgi:hypothetical protein